MLKKLTIVVLSACALAGCSAANPQTAMLASETLPAPSTCASTPVAGQRAYVVEGFGGKGDTQLMVTELRATTRCTQSGPAGRATLSPRD